MQIKPKLNDPYSQLHLPDAYMRWALLAAEEVVGLQGMKVVLRDAKMERFIDNYPPEEFNYNSQILRQDYANFNAALFNFFGRAGKSMVLRIGRTSARMGIQKQGVLFNTAAILAAKVMPFPTQVKMVLESIPSGFNKLAQTIGETHHSLIEDRGDRWAFTSNDCSICIGQDADACMCWMWVGTLQEGVHWLAGKEVDVVEVECRAMGAPACVWEVSKKPKE